MAGKCGADWEEYGCPLKLAALKKVLTGKNVPCAPSGRPRQEFRKLMNLREYHNGIGMKFCLNIVKVMKV